MHIASAASGLPPLRHFGDTPAPTPTGDYRPSRSLSLAGSERGAPEVRYYLYFAALRLIAQQPSVARWFQAKSQRPGACKGKLIVALMRRLAKGLWHQGQGQVFAIDKLFSSPPPCGA